jgi:hypothetical protein
VVALFPFEVAEAANPVGAPPFHVMLGTALTLFVIEIIKTAISSVAEPPTVIGVPDNDAPLEVEITALLWASRATATSKFRQ